MRAAAPTVEKTIAKKKKPTKAKTLEDTPIWMRDDWPKGRPAAQWDVQRPDGLVHAPALLSAAEAQPALNAMQEFERFCVQRFGIQYPHNAVHNFAHYMVRSDRVAEGTVLHDNPEDAIETNAIGFRTLKKGCSIAMPQWMRTLVDTAIAKLLALPPDQAAAAGLTPHLRRKLEKFEYDTCGAHLHRPGAGLGAHFDDTRALGFGFVFMLSIARPRQPYEKVTFHNGKTIKRAEQRTYPPSTEHRPRVFRFCNPMKGLKYEVATPNGSVTIFTDDAYDFWRHSSLPDSKMTDDVLSLTFRPFDPHSGYAETGAPPLDANAPAPKYRRGAPFADKYARKRAAGLVDD